MYILKINGLTAQRDTQALVKILLKVPGLGSERIAKGLRVPPFEVLSVEKEEQAVKIRELLEKFGAICEIINTEEPESVLEEYGKEYERFVAKTGAKTRGIEETIDLSKLIGSEQRHKFRWDFWLMILGFIILVTLPTIFFSESSNKPKPNRTQQAAQVVKKPPENKPKEKKADKTADKTEKKAEEKKASNSVKNNDLKKDLIKNPYNAGAWKTLSENLENAGDTAAARQAKENYERALRAQLIMASLAKTFGNEVRVETAEDAIYYRTNKDFTEDEFYEAAWKLRDSLATRFPGKNLIIENYTSDNRLQSIRLEAASP